MLPDGRAARRWDGGRRGTRRRVSHQTVSRVVNGHPSVAPHDQGAGAAGHRRAGLPAEHGRPGAGHRVDPHHRAGDGQHQPVRPGADDDRAGEGGPGGRLLAVGHDPGRRDGRGDARRHRPARRPVGRRRRGAGHLRRRLRGAALGVRTGAAGHRPERAVPRSSRRVGVDQVAGARLATRHLLDLGHRDGAPRRRPGGLARRPATACRPGAPSCSPPGRPVPEVLHGDWTPASGLRRRAPAGGPPPRRRAGHARCSWPTTRWPWGCWRRSTRRGCEVPDDVSVVGFDDLPEAPYFTPPLTTVRQDFAELGRRGVAAGARPAARGAARRRPRACPSSWCGGAPGRRRACTTWRFDPAVVSANNRDSCRSRGRGDRGGQAGRREAGRGLLT